MRYKGKHSEVIRKGDIAIKRFKKDLILNFWKEVYFLRVLQPFNFTPKIFRINPIKLEIEMEYVNGETIDKYLEENGIDEKILQSLKICRILDRLCINKKEMNHPDKHILISNRVVFIDFERATIKERPSNVTQFVVYLNKKLNLFKWEEIADILSRYKREYSDESFSQIIRMFNLAKRNI